MKRNRAWKGTIKDLEQIFQKINWIDILIVIVLAKSSYTGFTRGLGWEFCRLTGYISAILVSIYYYELISQLLSDYLPVVYPVANLLAFTAIYFIVLFIFKFINLFIEKIIKIEAFSMLEKGGGLLFGLMRGGITASLLLITLLFTPLPYFEKSIKERAFMGRTVSQVAPFVYEKIGVFFPALKLGQRNEGLLRLTDFRQGPPVMEKTKKNIKEYQKGSLRGEAANY